MLIIIDKVVLGFWATVYVLWNSWQSWLMCIGWHVVIGC